VYHCAERVRRYKSLWLRLGLLTQEFGTALGYSYACSLLVFFVQQVLAVYGLLSEMGRGFDVVNSTFAVSAVMFTYAIFVICDAGQLATEQVCPQLNFLTKTIASKVRTTGWKQVHNVRFQVLTAESMKITAFWDIASCSLVHVDRRFRGAYFLHYQGVFIAQMMEAVSTYETSINFYETTRHIFRECCHIRAK
jgi:hypothetical protein